MKIEIDSLRVGQKYKTDFENSSLEVVKIPSAVGSYPCDIKWIDGPYAADTKPTSKEFWDGNRQGTTAMVTEIIHTEKCKWCDI